jgi:hypothetical protein
MPRMIVVSSIFTKIETVTLPPPPSPPVLGDTVVVLSQRNITSNLDSSSINQPVDTVNRVRASKQRLASKQLVQAIDSLSKEESPPLGTWLHPLPKKTTEIRATVK